MRLPVSLWAAVFAVGVTLAVSPQRMTAQNTHDFQREAPEVRQLVFTGVAHIDVHENEPTVIRKIAISYDSTLIPGRIRDRLTLLRAKDPLDLVVLDSMRVLFQNELWDRGHGDAVVDTSVVVDTASRLADVELKLT